LKVPKQRPLVLLIRVKFNFKVIEVGGAALDIRRATLVRNFSVTVGRAAWEACSEILATCSSTYSLVRTS
jgi:hypothetical protein